MTHDRTELTTTPMDASIKAMFDRRIDRADAAGLRAQILTATADVAQARGWRRRLPFDVPRALPRAVAIALVIAGLVAAGLAGTGVLKLAPAPTGFAEEFIVPFEYAAPDDTTFRHTVVRRELVAWSSGPHIEATHEPDAALPLAPDPGDARGIYVASAAEPWSHRSAGRFMVRTAPAEFLADLRDQVGIDMGEIVETTLDGRPALSVMLPGTGGSDVHLYGRMGVGSEFVLVSVPARLTVADIDGTTVFVLAWARSTDDLPGLVARRQRIRVIDPLHEGSPAMTVGGQIHHEVAAPRQARVRTALHLTVAALAVILSGCSGAGPAAPSVESLPSTATAAPSAAPTVLGPADIGRSLTAGTYQVGKPFAAPFTIALPAGWSIGSLVQGDVSFGGPPGNDAGWLVVEVVENVYTDPCQSGSGPMDPPVDPTVDGIVGALTKMVGFNAGPVTDVVVGKHAGKAFDLDNGIDTNHAACYGVQMLPLWTYVGGGEAATNGGARERIWVLDVEGTPVIVDRGGSGVDEVATTLAFGTPVAIVPTASPKAAPSEPHLTYVALGDSLLFALPEDCDGCTSATVIYGQQIEAARGEPVEVHNLTMHNSLKSAGLRAFLENGAKIGRHPEDVFEAVAAADIVSVTIGFNDFDSPRDGRPGQGRGAVQGQPRRHPRPDRGPPGREADDGPRHPDLQQWWGGLEADRRSTERRDLRGRPTARCRLRRHLPPVQWAGRQRQPCGAGLSRGGRDPPEPAGHGGDRRRPHGEWVPALAMSPGRVGFDGWGLLR